MSLTFGADLTALDILDEELGLGRPVYPFDISRISETSAERAVQRERVRQRLRSDGWTSRSGRLRADIEDLLRVWARPDVLITQAATTFDEGSRLLYRGGWRGKTGVMSRQEGDVVFFQERRPEQVIDAMVRFLPRWDPVPAMPISYVQSAESRSADPDDKVFGGIDSSSPASPSRAWSADRFFTVPPLRAGVITCSAREPGTRTRPGRMVEKGTLTWFDTSEGRIFTTTEDLADGAQRHTITPADRARIAQWLRDRLSGERAGY